LNYFLHSFLCPWLYKSKQEEKMNLFKDSLTLIPNTFLTPYIWYKPHTNSLITVLRPGHKPPHVTMAAWTSSDLKYTWIYNFILLSNKHKREPKQINSHMETHLLTRSGTPKMYPSWTIFVSNNLLNEEGNKLHKLK